MLQARLPSFSRRESFDLALIGIIVAGLVALMAGLAIVREGNLTWDDAEYLYLGLEMSLWAKASGNLEHLRAISNMMHIGAKPPLLHGWIAQFWLWFGYRSPIPVIVGSSAIPFGLLAFAVVMVAWRLFGSRVALLAILGLAASPMMMGFGPRVLVETFLSLWVLLAYYGLAIMIARPGTVPALLLGTALGLAVLTKMTIPLLLLGAFLYSAYAYLRRYPIDATLARWIACVLLPMAVLDGPWYLKNWKSAMGHAVRSSSFNILITGGATVPRVQRVIDVVRDIIGWPLWWALIAAGVWAYFRPGRRQTVPEGPGNEFVPEGAGREFIRVTAIGSLFGAILLLVPSYFESRFLFPAWPAMVIAMAALLQEFSARGQPWRRAVPPLVFAIALGSSINSECRQPSSVTYWQLEGVIQKLVRDHGVRSLALLGNTGDWNFFKLRLINDLRLGREGPRARQSPFEISDLGLLSADDLVRTLDHTEALVMLDRRFITDEVLRSAPLVNRGYASVDRVLENSDGPFVEIEADSEVPPRFHLYVRRPGSEPGH